MDYIEIHDNSSIILALRKGDSQTFERVYRYYYRGLCAFTAQYVSWAEAEEIVQDTMMWLWENTDSLMDGLSLKTLLFTIAKNKALNLISHKEVSYRVHQEIAEKLENELVDSDWYIKNNELRELYTEALRALPHEFREAYMLNRNANLTHREIALRLHVSPQTVNYRICQALKFLRVRLKDYLPFWFFL